MSPLPPDILARWLPRWRALAESAQLAAREPESDHHAQQAMDLAEAATAQVGGWGSPFTDKRDQYVGAALLWASKAYGRQGSEAMRHTLAPALEHLALAFLARLERAAAKLEPRNDTADALALTVAAVVPLRRRRADIDDPED